jgi:LPXTG-site transpeptidase (sortase) family protein
VKRLLSLKWRWLPLAVALCVLLAPVAINYWHKNQTSSAARAADKQLDSPEPKRIQGLPNRILVPSLAIDLPVVPQTYSQATKTWPVAPGVANYATESAQTNNFIGETLIYGHNNRRVFGPLLNLKRGDVVYVYTDNGHIFKYSYAGSQDVTPEKTEIFQTMAKASAGLKIITCDGPNFEFRHLMSFKLLKAS